jgi:TonB-dependent SusC/RagA subfamily outer membrane receptor
LKDAASAAIYGARAAYGVILVTTKYGKQSAKPSVSFGMNYAINVPTVKFETFDALERMNYMNAGNMYKNGVLYSQFNEINGAMVLAHYNDPSQPAAFPDPNNPAIYQMSGNTDWPDLLIRDYTPQQQYSATVSGATDNFDYYTSINYFNQVGLNKIFDERYERYNFMTNLNYDVTKWAKIGTKISYNSSNKYYPPNNSANHNPEDSSPFQYHQWANWPVYFPNGKYASRGSVPNMVQFYNDAGYQTRDINDLWLTGSIILTPVKNMTFNMDYSRNVNQMAEMETWKRLPMYYVDGSVSGYFPYTNPSMVRKNQYNTNYYSFNAYADYQKKFWKTCC